MALHHIALDAIAIKKACTGKTVSKIIQKHADVAFMIVWLLRVQCRHSGFLDSKQLLQPGKHRPRESPGRHSENHLVRGSLRAPAARPAAAPARGAGDRLSLLLTAVLCGSPRGLPGIL